MALPITVPYTFGNATTAIPLSNLDSDYATVYQAVNGIGNGSVALANVTITGGTVSNVSGVVPTPFTANGVVYASSTSALTTGSALVFDGTNLGLGGTPNAWVTLKGFDIGSGGALWGAGAQAGLASNAYYGSGGFTYKSTNVAAAYQIDANIHKWYNAASGTAGNAITFTQAMTLDASGNLLVGTTSTGNSNSKSFVANVANGYIVVNHLNGQGSGSGYVSFGYNASEIGSITQNGTTGVLYNLTSDYRLKNNPEALTGAKDFVMALQPKKWQWWDGSGEGVGFVAHEFMEVAKYSGHGTKDAVDADGKPAYQSIQPSSSEVMANLVSFIQEQQAIIESLKARLDAANL